MYINIYSYILPTGKHGSETQGVIFFYPVCTAQGRRIKASRWFAKRRPLVLTWCHTVLMGRSVGPPRADPNNRCWLRVYEPPNHQELPGWWFGTFSVFPYIGIIIPNCFIYIFQRGRYTINQLLLNPYQPSIIGAAAVTLRWLLQWKHLSSESIGFNQQLSSVQSLCCLILGDYIYQSLYRGLSQFII